MLSAPEVWGVPWGVLPWFNPKMRSEGEDLAGPGWPGLCGAGAVELTAEMPRWVQAGANFSPSGVLSYHFHSWKAPPG